MESFNEISNWLYSEGDLVLLAAKAVTFIFVWEAACYMVGIIVSATKAAIK